MPEDIEKVELADEAADQIAEKTATLVAADAAASEVKSLRAAIEELKALMVTPKRSELEESGVKVKPGEAPVWYGGDDMFSSAGDTDADVATNLYLVKTLLQSNQNYLASPRLRQTMLNAADAAVAIAPLPIPKTIEVGGRTKAHDPDGFVGNTYRAFRAEAAATKAMTSTGANAGDEWVPTFASAELWRDVHLATAVSASVPRVAMPTNPYTLPTLDADVTFKHASSENVAVTASDLNTGNATLTAVKIQGEVNFSGELTEDSIIPIVPAIRANLVRRAGQVIDDLIVSGDTQTAGTGNVNLDDAAPTAGDFFLAFNGLRKFCITTNTAQVSNVAAALTTANFTTIRGLLGRYGARPSDLRIVTGQSTLNTMYDITQVKTLDVYGPNATILQGELARFFGIPILASETIPLLTSDKVEADGKASTTASNNTLGWLLLFNVNGWKQGFRRELQIESFRDIQKDQNILVASFRMALIPSGIVTTHTAVGRNITV